MEGELLCVDINLEWNSAFDNLLVQFSFRKKFMTSLKTSARQRIDSSLATADVFADIPAAYLVKPMIYLDDAVPGPRGCKTPDQINILQVESVVAKADI